MTFLEIIRHASTNLPIEQSSKVDFREILKRRLTDFDKMVQESDNLSEAVGGVELKPGHIKKKSALLVKGILNTIDAYYKGNLDIAYDLLSSALKDANITGYLNKDYQFPANANFYRIRLTNGNYPLHKKELFHIPFELRGKVATQRYSIPGLPSLYLSNSLYVAWEELRRPDFNEIQSVRFVNKRPLTMLDLTSTVYCRNDHFTDNTSYGWYLLYKVMIWPLVAACSVKVRNPTDTFKPEYIIPQLLLRWVNKTAIDGIMYSSTHIDLNTGKHQGEFQNFVLPVKTFDKDSGYCTRLKNLFRSTQVLPMQLRQFVTPYSRLDEQASIMATVNGNISSIELIKGNVQPYHATSFGILEHSLNHLALEKVC